ncbi:MAG TPA: transporter substrate-binding domain-containing protein [Castellaniella sp.]|jgi:polar amino acid transport system substrate-binding protein|nr:transporter substrate-binding domain-containing protein [Castellaniella sp.]
MKRFPLNCGFAALAVSAATLCVALSPAQAASLAQVQQQKTLRVAVDLNAPPYGMKDASLKEIGSDVETAQLLAKDLGVKLDIVPTTQANRIPFLLTNKADVVVSSLTITPERQKVVDFTIPYAAIQSVIAAPASENIKTMDDLAGKTVVTARGTTNDANVTKLAPAGTDIVRFENDATAMTAVTSGRSHIYSGAPAIIASLNKQLADSGKPPLVTKIVMATSMLGIGVAKNNPELLDKMNELIRKNLKNGELNTIYKKYHGADLPAEIVAEGK